MEGKSSKETQDVLKFSWTIRNTLNNSARRLSHGGCSLNSVFKAQPRLLSVTLGRWTRAGSCRVYCDRLAEPENIPSARNSELGTRNAARSTLRAGAGDRAKFQRAPSTCSGVREGTPLELLEKRERLAGQERKRETERTMKEPPLDGTPL
ncbi:hypothetical protein SRHO_G00334620 [Serrasalmus rhombeus]